MAYNNNIPQPADFLDVSQPDLLNNFKAIKTLVDINHVTFDLTDQGKHKWISFPLQTAAPTFAANETGLYNKIYATTVKDETYIHKEIYGGTADIPFSASVMSSTDPSNSMDGWTFLPSGLLIRWQAISGTGLTTINLAGTPAFSFIFTILLTPIDSSTSDANKAVSLVSIDSTSQFKVFFSNRTSTGAAAGNAKVLIIGA